MLVQSRFVHAENSTETLTMFLSQMSARSSLMITQSNRVFLDRFGILPADRQAIASTSISDNLTNRFQCNGRAMLIRALASASCFFLGSYNLPSRCKKTRKEARVFRASAADSRRMRAHTRPPLTNAHSLSRSNYRIKLSLLIPNTILIAAFHNLLNCSITRNWSIVRSFASSFVSRASTNSLSAFVARFHQPRTESHVLAVSKILFIEIAARISYVYFKQ